MATELLVASVFLFLLAGAAVAFDLKECKRNRPPEECNIVSKCYTANKPLVDCINITFTEPHRPQVHLTPKAGYAGVPNGMLASLDLYSVFYDYNPNDIVPETSDLQVATSLMGFDSWQSFRSLGIKNGKSASSYVNDNKRITEFRDNVLVIYTRVNENGVPEHGLAVGPKEEEGLGEFADKGIVIPNNKENNPPYKDDKDAEQKADTEKELGDPQVFYYKEGNYFVLLLANCDRVVFYKSLDFKKWEFTGSFGEYQGNTSTTKRIHSPTCEIGKEMPLGGVLGDHWRNPSLVRFVEDVDGTNLTEPLDALIVSIEGALDESARDGPNMGSGTMYFVGKFDGKSFVPKEQSMEPKWLDYGPDNYGGNFFSTDPLPRHHFYMAKMSNSNYAGQEPTFPWRSAMTYPRSLKPKKTADSKWIVTQQFPLFYNCSSALFKFQGLKDRGVFNTAQNDTDAYVIEVTFTKTLGNEVGLSFANNASEKVVFTYDTTKAEFTLDRSNAGIPKASQWMNKMNKATAKRISTDKTKFVVVVLLDTSSIEILADGGEVGMTSIFFPSRPFFHFEAFAKGGTPDVTVSIQRLKNDWLESCYEDIPEPPFNGTLFPPIDEDDDSAAFSVTRGLCSWMLGVLSVGAFWFI